MRGVKRILPAALLALLCAGSLADEKKAQLCGFCHRPGGMGAPLLEAQPEKFLAATITAYIVQMSLGDLPHGSLAYSTIFATGLVLFIITLGFNVLGFFLRRKFREAY